MSPGQLFVGDIGIALAVIDRGPLAWADISEVLNYCPSVPYQGPISSGCHMWFLVAMSCDHMVR